MSTITFLDELALFSTPSSGGSGGVSNVIVDSGSIEITNLSKYAEYKTHKIEELTGLTFILQIGEDDASWLILKIEEIDSENTSITYASGESDSDTAWDDRATLVYTNLNETL